MTSLISLRPLRVLLRIVIVCMTVPMLFARDTKKSPAAPVDRDQLADAFMRNHFAEYDV